MRLGGFFGALSMALIWGSCADGSARAPASNMPRLPCDVNSGVRVDSAFAVTQASRALEGFLPTGGSLEPYAVEVVREGMLVSLVPVRPLVGGVVLGGGGLVWVDEDTGCPIVLRRYE